MIFVKNWQFFHLLILFKIDQENVFYDILNTKNALLDYKNIKLKRTKNWYFPKGVSPSFLSKMGIFLIFLFKAK